MNLRNFLISISRLMGFFPSRLSPFGILQINKCLMPIDNGYDLIRIGANRDGGYLVPNDLDEIDMCFSAGVADNFSFENDLFAKFGIASIMYDGAICRPSKLPSQHTFYKKFVGSSTFKDFISASDVIHVDFKNCPGDLLAQIDIEGGEFELFNAMSELELKRFRIIVIEVHELDRWLQFRYLREIVSPFLDKVFSSHHLIHSHVNNNGGDFRYRGKKYPKVVELTFHRKDRAIASNGYRAIPHYLDADNF